LNPTKAFGLSVEGWCALKRNCPLPFQKNKFEQCHLQWLKRIQWWCHHHPPLMGPRTCMKKSYMQHFLGYLNWTELKQHSSMHRQLEYMWVQVGVQILPSKRRVWLFNTQGVVIPICT